MFGRKDKDSVEDSRCAMVRFANGALATAQNVDNQHAVLGSISGGGSPVGGALRMGLTAVHLAPKGGHDGVAQGRNIQVAHGLFGDFLEYRSGHVPARALGR